MKKFLTTILTGVSVLALATGLFARTDLKVHSTGGSSAEIMAQRPVEGFRAPRARQGSPVRLMFPSGGTATLNATLPGGMEKAYIEYVPELKGMNWTATSTTLQDISADGTLTPVMSASLSAQMGTPSGACGYGSNYYVTIKYTYPNGMQIYYGFVYDTETWTMQGNPSSLSQRFMSTDLTVDPTDGKIYGCFTNDTSTGYEFGTANFLEGERTTISELPAGWNAIAADKTGQIFAIDMDGTLLKVNKTNGEVTEVGATGFVPQNVSSATFDHKTGKLYWTVSTDEAGFLCEVNPETGAATKIADFAGADEIYGLFVKAPAAEDEAPAEATNLRLDFVDDALAGHLIFDAPETLFRGQDAEGEFSYVVKNGAETLVEGTAQFGEKNVESPEFSVPGPGRYTFTLICSNEAGPSPKTEISGFIGEDAPAIVTNARAEYADGEFTVSWTAPATSANGGYINPAEIKYTVTRMPDNVVVADGISETSITDPVEEPESFVKYKYTIIASYNGLTSYPVNTNGVGLGSIVPPFTDDFSDTGFLESYSVIDTDGDGRGFASFIGMAQSLGAPYGAEDTSCDQWLVTPAVKLQGGKFYKLGIDAATMGASWTEKFEVMVGDAIEAEAFTVPVIPLTDVSTASFMMTQHFEEYFTVPEDGIYYIGLHHVNDNSYMLLFDNLSISEPIEGAAPDVVQNLTITPAPGGEKKVTVAFRAPATDLSGSPLEFLDRVEIKLDDQDFHTVTGIAPADSVNVELAIPVSGMHKFTVTPWNGSTEGRSVEAELHVGKDVPAVPANANAVTGSDPKTIEISWDPVTKDAGGLDLSADEVTYYVVRLVGNQQEMIGMELSDTHFTHTPSIEAGSQEFFQYAVFAHDEAGFSNGGVTQMLAVGDPDTLPWIESFSNGYVDHIFAAHALDGTNGAWVAFGDQSFSNGVKSFDADNGMMGMYGPQVGDKARLFTGKIDFTGLEHPSLSFYTFNLQGSAEQYDLNEITIMADDGNGYTPVRTLVINDVAEGIRGWAKAVVDLTAYAGKTIQLALDAETKVYLYTLIDLLEITDRKDNDLMLKVDAPSSAYLDKEFVLTAVVENIGRLDASGYDVVLSNNGVPVETLQGEALAPGKTAEYSFNCMLNATDEDQNIFKVEVVYAADENKADNVAEAAVRLRHNNFPPVREVSVERLEDNSARIRWQAPDEFSAEDVVITEDFEDADTQETFPTEYGDWTFLDEDKGFIGGIQGTELPGIQTGSQQGFWVMDSAHPVFGGNTSYHAHSGTKYLAQMYTMNANASGPVDCDDWIISPLLNEKKQTIEFWARSYGNDTSERFQFLYSTTGTEPEDFTSVAVVPSVPNTWTRYEYEVPQGAKYFAIRCTSIFEFMLFIDDITYVPANGSNVILEGYNVYIDGVRANSSLLNDCEYLVAPASAGDDNTRFSVTAVYSRGESRGVTVSTDPSGVDSVGAATAVVPAKGCLIVNGEIADVTVWSADGTVRFAGKIGQGGNIPLDPGVYVVAYNEKIGKVIIQ